MRYRRPEVYGGRGADEKPAQSDFILNITLEEQFKRMERLGLPIPVIESDYEEMLLPMMMLERTRINPDEVATSAANEEFARAIW